MFYTESGHLLLASGEGDENIIYTISSKNLAAFMNEIKGYKNYWKQKRAPIGYGGKYNDPNYFQNLADKYGSNTYNVIAGYGYNGEPYTFGYRNVPWYMYVVATAAIAWEGYYCGRRGIPIDSEYNVSYSWNTYYGLKEFDPWW